MTPGSSSWASRSRSNSAPGIAGGGRQPSPAPGRPADHESPRSRDLCLCGRRVSCGGGPSCAAGGAEESARRPPRGVGVRAGAFSRRLQARHGPGCRLRGTGPRRHERRRAGLHPRPHARTHDGRGGGLPHPLRRGEGRRQGRPPLARQRLHAGRDQATRRRFVDGQEVHRHAHPDVPGSHRPRQGQGGALPGVEGPRVLPAAGSGPREALRRGGEEEPAWKPTRLRRSSCSRSTTPRSRRRRSPCRRCRVCSWCRRRTPAASTRRTS